MLYPIKVIEDLMEECQRAGLTRDGDPKLLAAIFLGCLLRPMIVSQLAGPGAFDLLNDTAHDKTILAAAWSAIRKDEP